MIGKDEACGQKVPERTRVPALKVIEGMASDDGRLLSLNVSTRERSA
jgi:hypothetical protein